MKGLFCWCFLIPVSVMAADPGLSLIKTYVENGALLTAQREITDRLSVQANDHAARSWQRSIETRVAQMETSSLAGADAVYAKLFRAWTKGDALQARNAAYQYLALIDREENVSKAQRSEVRLLFDQLESQRQDNLRLTQQSTMSIVTASLDEKPLPVIKPRRAPHRPSRTAESKKKEAARKPDVTALVRRADRLREDGRLEEARRLYRLAEEADPTSEAARVGMERLEMEWQ